MVKKKGCWIREEMNSDLLGEVRFPAGRKKSCDAGGRDVVAGKEKENKAIERCLRCSMVERQMLSQK